MADLLSKAKAAALFLWGLFPRFISEDVALRYVGSDPDDWSGYEIACSMEDLEPGERFDAIATVDAFSFLVFGMTYRIGNFRPFQNPHGVKHG
jgi:hypothetical protein